MRSFVGAVAVLLLMVSVTPVAADDTHDSAESVVGALYELVTFGPEENPDWDRVRALFLEDAVIVLRTSREATSVFGVDGFVDDFVSFIENRNVKVSGFAETIVRTTPMVFGDIAHVLVLYTAEIPGSGREPQYGVDSFQLIRRDNRWWIASIVNEIPMADRPIPAQLQDQAAGEAGVREAIERLSAATAPDGGGPDAYRDVLAEDFARWTPGSEKVDDRDSWVEGMRGWWVDGWRVSDRETSMFEISVRAGFAFTRRVVTETYLGPDGDTSSATAAVTEVWVQRPGGWKLLRADVHPVQ